MAGPVAGLAPVKNDPRPATDRGTVVPQSAAGPTSRTTNVKIAYSACVRLPMRHFYFHLRAGEQLILDLEGLELPDVSAARRKAIKSAREILAAAIRAG
jgi:Domain of unknown function (DUF6894)